MPTLKPLLLALVAFLSLLTLPQPAEAGHFCREKARQLYREVAPVTTAAEAAAALVADAA